METWEALRAARPPAPRLFCACQAAHRLNDAPATDGLQDRDPLPQPQPQLPAQTQIAVGSGPGRGPRGIRTAAGYGGARSRAERAGRLSPEVDGGGGLAARDSLEGRQHRIPAPWPPGQAVKFG